MRDGNGWGRVHGPSARTDGRGTDRGARWVGLEGRGVEGGGAVVGTTVAVGFVEDVGEVIEGAIENFGVSEVVGVGEGSDGLGGPDVGAVDFDAEDVAGVGESGNGETGGGEGEGVGEAIEDAVVGIGVAVVMGAVGAGVVEPRALEEEDFVAADIEGEDGVVVALGGELEDAGVGDGDFLDGVVDFIEDGFLVVATFGAAEVEDGPEENGGAEEPADAAAAEGVVDRQHAADATADEGEDERGKDAEEKGNGEVGTDIGVRVAVDGGKFVVGGWAGLQYVHDVGTPSTQQQHVRGSRRRDGGEKRRRREVLPLVGTCRYIVARGRERVVAKNRNFSAGGEKGAKLG